MTLRLALALAVALAGQVLYHWSQKGVPAGAHPVVSLIAFYTVAIVCSLPLFLVFPPTRGLGDEIARIGAPVVLVGVAIVLIEAGFLFAYREGGELSTAFVFTSAIVAASLLLLGVLVLGERLTATRVAGLALAVGGIALLARR